jgi:hypothetical protein
MKKILKKISIDFLKYIAFTALFILIGTATASNKKSQTADFENNENLTPTKLSNMKIDWNNIYNKPPLNWKEEIITYKVTNEGGACAPIGTSNWKYKSHYIDLPKYTKNISLSAGGDSVGFVYDGSTLFGWKGDDCKYRSGNIYCNHSYNAEGGLPTDRIPVNSRIRIKVASACSRTRDAKLKVTYLTPGDNIENTPTYETSENPNSYENSTEITITE